MAAYMRISGMTAVRGRILAGKLLKIDFTFKPRSNSRQYGPFCLNCRHNSVNCCQKRFSNIRPSAASTQTWANFNVTKRVISSPRKSHFHHKYSHSVISFHAETLSLPHKYKNITPQNTARLFSSQSGQGNADDPSGASSGGVGEGGDGEDPSDMEPEIPAFNQPPNLTAIAPMTVPEYWPKVPVIAVKRNPVFPRFIKMIEVCLFHTFHIIRKLIFAGKFIELNHDFEIYFQITDSSLMDLIRRKVRLNQPYAGVFLKRDDE